MRKKDGVVQRRTYYIVTEKSLTLFRAIESLCKYANTMNFELGYSTHSSMSIELGKLLEAVPLEFKKFVTCENSENGSRLRHYITKILETSNTRFVF